MQVPGEEWYSKGTGALLIVFGCYRIVLYYLGVRRRSVEDEEEMSEQNAEERLEE